MRISDWSSDVCSSDLIQLVITEHRVTAPHRRSCSDQPIQIVISHDTRSDVTGQQVHYDAYVRILVIQVFIIENPSVGTLLWKLPGILGRRMNDYRSDERRVGKECVRQCRYWWLTKPS